MRVSCSATIEEQLQRENLVQCANIIGVSPVILGDTVFADYDGDVKTADKLMELFQQFPFHGISVLNWGGDPTIFYKPHFYCGAFSFYLKMWYNVGNGDALE